MKQIFAVPFEAGGASPQSVITAAEAGYFPNHFTARAVTREVRSGSVVAGA